jgi:hypothetical protein
VALVRTDISEELSASIIRVTKIGELEALAVTSNRRTLRRNTEWLCCRDDEGGKFLRNVGSYKSHTAYTSQKTPFFIVTAVITSNLAHILSIVSCFSHKSTAVCLSVGTAGRMWPWLPARSVSALLLQFCCCLLCVIASFHPEPVPSCMS